MSDLELDVAIALTLLASVATWWLLRNDEAKP